MPEIAGELHSSSEDATECSELESFSCGDGRLPSAEGAVQRIVAKHRGGGVKGTTFRVTREYPAGSLVGVAAIEWPGLIYRHPSFPTAAFADAALIDVLSLAEAYRGGFRSASGERLGDVLMRDALQFIESESEEQLIVPVQAIISPENLPSQALATRFGFKKPFDTEPDLWYLRPRGLPIAPPDKIA